MDRCRRVSRLWNWLPSFRAVAETENLAAASACIHVTPPALSRTIRLLEEDLGIKLFDRVGRSLTLNPAGQELLLAVRESIRRIHDCVDRISNELPREVRISAAPPYTRRFIRPALSAMQRDPEVRLDPHFCNLPDSSIPGALRQGVIDIAIVSEVPRKTELHVTALAPLTASVHRAPGHFSDTPRFAVPLDPATGRALDGWPKGTPRTIGLKVGCLQGVLDAVVHDGALAFLPDLIGKERGLERLDDGPEEALRLYLVRRLPLSDRSAIDQTADAIAAQIELQAGEENVARHRIPAPGGVAMPRAAIDMPEPFHHPAESRPAV